MLSYDPTGQITKQVWQHRGGTAQEQRYHYDSLGRLTSWADASDSTSYVYDEVGNRLTATESPAGFGAGGWFDSYQYNPTAYQDRLQKRHRIDATHHRWTTYTHDADGAVTVRQRRDSLKNAPWTVTTYPAENFHYSFRELLWRYTFNGATHDWRYRYSAAGEREQKRLYPVDTSNLSTAENNPWVYYLLGAGKEQLAVWHGRENYINPVTPYCPAWELGKVYLYPVEYNTFGGSTSRISTRPDADPNGIKTYRIADHLGSNRVYIDEDLTIRTADYEPFGKAVTGGGTDMRQSFIDKEKDFENGLGDFGVRKYEEETGRFLSVDPLWEEFVEWTPYHYSSDDPLGIADPSGLEGEQRIEKAPRQTKPYDVDIGSGGRVGRGPDGGGGARSPGKSGGRSGRTSSKMDDGRLHASYTKDHPDPSKGRYSGRTSGSKSKSPEQIVRERDAKHHKNKEGYEPAKLDKSGTRGEIRGREQQNIDANGGARSNGGTSGNAINGVSPNNPRYADYTRN